MKILIIQSKDNNSMLRYTALHQQKIKKIADTIQIVFAQDTKESVEKSLPQADIVIFSPSDFPKLVDFNKAKNLKFAQITSAGATDVAFALKDTNILLANASGVHPIPIAEHVFTFILMFARQLYKSYRIQLDEKKWVRDNESFQISELYGSTIGIVGFGRIGKRIAEVAKGFNMKILTLSHNWKTKDLSFLLKSSDYVVNALPLTSETKHFFSRNTFKQMKESAYFINIGRGKTVIEIDLEESLENHVIAGAGLDVFYQEPLSQKSKLWNMQNVIITCHYAGWTPRYTDRVVDIFCANLKAYLQNKKIPTLVDKASGY